MMLVSPSPASPLHPVVASDHLPAVGTSVHAILAGINAEWDEATSEPQAAKEKKDINIGLALLPMSLRVPMHVYQNQRKSVVYIQCLSSRGQKAHLSKSHEVLRDATKTEIMEWILNEMSVSGKRGDVQPQGGDSVTCWGGCHHPRDAPCLNDIPQAISWFGDVRNVFKNSPTQ